MSLVGNVFVTLYVDKLCVRVRVFRWRSMCSMTGVVLSVGGGRGGSLADGDVEGVGTDRPLSAL